MKFSPLPTTGIAVAAVAAISATAVALKKKGKKIVKPIASFTAQEWEDVKNWPAVKAVIGENPQETPTDNNESTAVSDAETAPVAEENTDSEEATAEESSTPEVAAAVDTASDVPKRVVIGDEPGQVKASSAEYRKIVNKAFKDASKDDSVTLELYGKTYGLGAKGQKIEGSDLPGTLYTAGDIAKLHKKLSA